MGEEEKGKVVCFKSCITGLNFQVKTQIYKLPLQHVYHVMTHKVDIQARTAEQDTKQQQKKGIQDFSCYLCMARNLQTILSITDKAEIQCISPPSKQSFQGIWMHYGCNFHLFSTSGSYASYIFNFCLLRTSELAANQQYN